jgi:hypothetical protein
MITSGLVIQNYGKGFFPSQKMSRAYENFSVTQFPVETFDTGFQKTPQPSTFQETVFEDYEKLPRSVFQPKNYGRKYSIKNTMGFGQTVLRDIFSKQNNQLTDYAAQQLQGVVENKNTFSVQDYGQPPQPNNYNVPEMSDTMSITTSQYNPEQKDLQNRLQYATEEYLGEEAIGRLRQATQEYFDEKGDALFEDIQAEQYDNPSKFLNRVQQWTEAGASYVDIPSRDIESNTSRKRKFEE